MTAPRLGFIGQGWIGKHYADEFESRGYAVVRYALEPEYAGNRERIATCDLVFIAVPTPTTPAGFDSTAVESALCLVGSGKVAIIKSTVLPGTTNALQERFPEVTVLTSPEFLREATAAYDAAHPVRTLIGIPEETKRHRDAAAFALSVLPEAPYVRIMSARAAELVKYAGNVFLAEKVVFANMLSDLATALNASYDEVRDALQADPRIGSSHLAVMDASGHGGPQGRGAGGHCFIKDLEAFRRLYASTVSDSAGMALMGAMARKNAQLLRDSGKDLDLLRAVYGPEGTIPA